MATYRVRAGESAAAIFQRYRSQYQGLYTEFVRHVGRVSPGELVTLPTRQQLSQAEARPRTRPRGGAAFVPSVAEAQPAPSVAAQAPEIGIPEGAGVTRRVAPAPPLVSLTGGGTTPVAQQAAAARYTGLAGLPRTTLDILVGRRQPREQPIVSLTGQPQFRSAALPDVQRTPTGELPPGTPLVRLTAGGVTGGPQFPRQEPTRGRAGTIQPRSAELRLTEAARWTGLAIANRTPPTTMTPRLQAALGLSDADMVAMGYAPDPGGYWALQQFGQPGGGGGRRTFGGGGGGRGGRGGLDGGPVRGLFQWRIG